MAITLQSRTSAAAPWGTLNALGDLNALLTAGRKSIDEVKAEASKLLQRWTATIHGAYAEMEFRIHDDSVAERAAAPEPATAQTLKPGTQIEFTPAGGVPELATILRPRKANQPLPGPGWYVVRFADGGSICMHETAFRVIGKAA